MKIADGQLELHTSVSPDGAPVTFGHTVLDLPDTDAIAWRGKREVKARSLGSLVDGGEIPARVGIVKIDTEGTTSRSLRYGRSRVRRGDGRALDGLAAHAWPLQVDYGRDVVEAASSKSAVEVVELYVTAANDRLAVINEVSRSRLGRLLLRRIRDAET
jgi:hypothetical protein